MKGREKNQLGVPAYVYSVLEDNMETAWATGKAISLNLLDTVND